MKRSNKSGFWFKVFLLSIAATVMGAPLAHAAGEKDKAPATTEPDPDNAQSVPAATKFTPQNPNQNRIAALDKRIEEAEQDLRTRQFELEEANRIWFRNRRLVAVTNATRARNMAKEFLDALRNERALLADEGNMRQQATTLKLSEKRRAEANERRALDRQHELNLREQALELARINPPQTLVTIFNNPKSGDMQIVIDGNSEPPFPTKADALAWIDGEIDVRARELDNLVTALEETPKENLLSDLQGRIAELKKDLGNLAWLRSFVETNTSILVAEPTPEPAPMPTPQPPTQPQYPPMARPQGKNYSLPQGFLPPDFSKDPMSQATYERWAARARIDGGFPSGEVIYRAAEMYPDILQDASSFTAWIINWQEWEQAQQTRPSDRRPLRKHKGNPLYQNEGR